mmetsp:Transcript_24425/g.57911  ORF Transcript_24425/g.57911 Transcript_24425/m.57911 type:complete len:234 (+) Transcript_24425:43-744(+)
MSAVQKSRDIMSVESMMAGRSNSCRGMKIRSRSRNIMPNMSQQILNVACGCIAEHSLDFCRWISVTIRKLSFEPKEHNDVADLAGIGPVFLLVNAGVIFSKSQHALGAKSAASRSSSSDLLTSLEQMPTSLSQNVLSTKRVIFADTLAEFLSAAFLSWLRMLLCLLIKHSLVPDRRSSSLLLTRAKLEFGSIREGANGGGSGATGPTNPGSMWFSESSRFIRQALEAVCKSTW